MVVLGAGALLPWETKWQDSLSVADDSRPRRGGVPQRARLRSRSFIGWDSGPPPRSAHFATSLGEQNRTQATQQNLRLADNEAALRKALDSILDPLCIIDLRTQRYINVNEEFLIATGFTREEAIGKRWQELNIWFDEASAERLIKRVVSDLKVRNEEIMVRGRRRNACPRAGFIGGAGTGRTRMRPVHRARHFEAEGNPTSARGREPRRAGRLQGQVGIPFQHVA